MRFKLLKTAILMITAFAVQAAAQAGPPAGAGTPAGAGDRNLAGDNIKTRSVEMERIRKENLPSDPEEAKAVKFQQIKDDFERLQIVNNNELQPIVNGGELEFKKLASSADEIEARAARLNTNLFGAKKQKKKSKKKLASLQGTREELVKGWVIALDNSLQRFVSSPIFNNSGVADAADAKAAQDELEKVIALAYQIREKSKENK